MFKLRSDWIYLLCMASFLFRSLTAQSPVQIGFARFTPENPGVSAAVAALFSFRNEKGILLWEAGVPASRPFDAAIIFVDQRGGNRTGLALVNVGAQPAVIRFVLRDLQGNQTGDLVRFLPAGQNFALFVDELFMALPPEFAGTLTFREVDGNETLAAITLRESRNAHGEAIFTALPVAPLTAPGNSSAVLLPQIGAGSGLSTRIILINPYSVPLQGTVRFRTSSGTAMRLEIDGAVRSEIFFHLPPFSGVDFPVSLSSVLNTGYAVIRPSGEAPAPAAVALFQMGDERGPVSEAGITATTPSGQLRLSIDQAGTRSGLAVVNPEEREALLEVELLDHTGQSMGLRKLTLLPGAHRALFADELFERLPAGFTGAIEIRSTLPVAVTSLKLSVNKRGDAVLTTLPFFDLEALPAAGESVFPQIAIGGGFATRFLFLSSPSIDRIGGILRLFRSSGAPLEAPWPGGTGAEIPVELAAGGALQIRPGDRIVIAGRIFDSRSGQPITGAVIGSDLDESSALSDSTGHFLLLSSSRFSGCCPLLSVRVCATGYAPIQISRKAESPVVQIDFRLDPVDRFDCRGLPSVKISGVDLLKQRLHLDLQPVVEGGVLEIEAVGPVTSAAFSATLQFSGPRTEPLDLFRLPVAQFSRFRATWTVGGVTVSDEFQSPFKVLGDYFHSRYNIPDETDCGGVPEGFCHTTGDCIVTQCQWNSGAFGRSEWLSEVQENGAGLSSQLGFVGLEFFCNRPAGCQVGLRDLIGEENACPACRNRGLRAGETVAVRPDHPDLDCGDQVLVEGLGLLEVTDKGNLPSFQQLDHFAGVSGCNVPVSIGNRVTIRLDE